LRHNIIPGDEVEKVKNTQFHCWVEDARGEKVFDPEFTEYYSLIRALRGCDEDADRIYVKYKRQEECLKIAMKIAIEKSINLDKSGLDGYYPDACSVNCLRFMRKNEDKNYKICIGAFGWKKRDGSIWFEYG
jgi:hypothetical protein